MLTESQVILQQADDLNKYRKQLKIMDRNQGAHFIYKELVNDMFGA